MRIFVVFAACLALAAADIGLKLRQAAEARASSYDVGQQSVSLDYAPTLFQDTVAGGATGASGLRSDFGAGALSSASAGATAYGGAAAGSFGGSNADYQAGYEAGLRAGGLAGASAGASASASSGAFSGASSGGFGGSSFGGASAGASATAAAKTNVRYAAPVIQKHFYYHAAPEEPQAAAEADSLTITPRKHYKIIFIKAPTVSANAGAASRAASQTEEKTIVYVLVNKPAQAKAGAVADASSFSSGKPEVYFIRYQGKDAAQAIANAQANSFAGADAGAGAVAGSFAGASSLADAGANAASYADSGAFGGASGFGGSSTLSGASANAASVAGSSSYDQFDVRSDALAGAGVQEFAGGAGNSAGTSAAANAAASAGFANNLQDTVVY